MPLPNAERATVDMAKLSNYCLSATHPVGRHKAAAGDLLHPLDEWITMNEIELLATVAVREDLPELGLRAGEVGAVVEVLSAEAFEVEFVDQQGKTYGLHTLTRSQVLPLHQAGRAWRARAEVA